MLTHQAEPDLTAPYHAEQVANSLECTFGLAYEAATLRALSAKLEAADAENLILHEANEGLGSAAWEATKRAEAAEAERDSYRRTANEMAERTAKAEAERDAALGVLQEMRDDKTGFRDTVHFRRRAAAFLAARQKGGEG